MTTEQYSIGYEEGYQDGWNAAMEPSQQEPAQMTEWAHLPNAAHIDRVLTHVRAHPDKWSTARDAARDAAWVAAWSAAKDTDRDAASDAASDAAIDAAMGAAMVAAMVAAMSAARGACMALVAWDDCAYILDMHPDAVKLLNNPAAVLLYPAVIAMQGEANE